MSDAFGRKVLAETQVHNMRPNTEAAPTVLSLLQPLLSADSAARQTAETRLAEASKQSGFGAALVQTVLQQQYPEGIRQLAAVLLKRHVKEHWATESKHFKEPVVADNEKTAIRSQLPQGLADPLPKLRTAASMAIAAIAKWDLPDAWPGLFEMIVGAITSKSSQQSVDGAVRCLSLLADDLAEEQIVQAVPVLVPELLAIVSQDGQYSRDIQRRALEIMHTVVSTLSTLSGDELKQMQALLGPMLGPWFAQFGRILSSATDAQDVAGWGLKLEALKVVQACVQYMGKLVGAHLQSLMGHAWQLFLNSQPLYQHLVINNSTDSELHEVDEEGNSLNFESLLSQLLEVIITIVSNKRFCNLLDPVVPQLVYVTIGYMQMTQDQVENWSQNPDQYVADEEEETFSVRVSGELVLDELLDAFPEAAVAAVASAVHKRFQEADEAKAAGNENWWRLREAALLATGAVADALLEVQANQQQPSLDVAALLASVLQKDLMESGSPPFLMGRALWMASRLAEALNEKGTIPFLQAAAAGLGPDQAAPVQIGSCRALALLCPRVPNEALQPLLSPIYQGLGGMLQGSGEDVLHLVLECLAAVIRVDEEGAQAWEAHITPCVLQLWVHHIADPLLAMEAGGVIQALAAGPAFPNLLAKVLPVLASIISHAISNSPVLVEGALDLVGALLKPAAPEQAQQMHALLAQPVQALLMQHDDPGVLQSCSQYLKTLIGIGGVDVLSWGNMSPQDSLQSMLQAVSRLLQPGMGDSASLYIGDLILQILLKMPAQVGPIVPQLLPPVVAKLAEADSSPLIVNLLLVIAQLVHINTTQLVDCLAAQPAPDGKGSGLDAVMTIWIDRQAEVLGPYRINLATTALAQLLASRHPALANLQVKGRRMDVNSAIRTRSRAKQQAEQWQMVPLPAKLLAMLTDTVTESRAQKAAGANHRGAGNEDDSDDWEDEDDEDGSLSGFGLGFGLDEIAAVGDEEVDDHLSDPLAKLDLEEHLVQQLRGMGQADSAWFQSLCVALTPDQIQTVESIFGQ